MLVSVTSVLYGGGREVGSVVFWVLCLFKYKRGGRGVAGQFSDWDSFYTRGHTGCHSTNDGSTASCCMVITTFAPCYKGSAQDCCPTTPHSHSVPPVQLRCCWGITGQPQYIGKHTSVKAEPEDAAPVISLQLHYWEKVGYTELYTT